MNGKRGRRGQGAGSKNVVVGLRPEALRSRRKASRPLSRLEELGADAFVSALARSPGQERLTARIDALSVLPGQLFAAAVAQAKGLDIDTPAGLQKVTLVA